MKSKYIFGLMFVVLVQYAQAQTMHDIVRQIVNGNAEIASKELQIQADKYAASDGNALSNPEVNFARVWGKDGIGNKLQLDISQSFDWPGLYHKRSQANAMAVTAARQQLLSEKLDMALEAKQLLCQLVYVRKQEALLESLLDNMQLLAKAVAIGVDQGEITILDQRKAQLETYKYQNDLAVLKAREKELCANIASLSGDAGLDLAGVREYFLEPLKSLAEYQQQMQTLDPALIAGRMAVQQDELNGQAAALSRFPSFSVGYQHQAEMGDRFNGFTVGMTLPFFENRHARAAERLRRDANEKAQAQLLVARSAQIESKYAQMEVWKSQMDQFRSLFGDNVYLTLLQKAYDGGQMSVIDYISESNYYRENSMAYLELECNYQEALSQLNKYELLQIID